MTKETVVAHVAKKKKAMTRQELHAVLYFVDATGVPTPWSFRLHHYGPFSEKLDYDLEDLEFKGAITIQKTARETRRC